MQYTPIQEEAVQRAIQWTKTGKGYFLMRESLNNYLEDSGLNHAYNDNQEAILLGRKLGANQIATGALYAMSIAENRRLQDELMKIAEYDMPTPHRGIHR